MIKDDLYDELNKYLVDMANFNTDSYISYIFSIIRDKFDDYVFQCKEENEQLNNKIQRLQTQICFREKNLIKEDDC